MKKYQKNIFFSIIGCWISLKSFQRRFPCSPSNLIRSLSESITKAKIYNQFAANYNSTYVTQLHNLQIQISLSEMIIFKRDLLHVMQLLSFDIFKIGHIKNFKVYFLFFIFLLKKEKKSCFFNLYLMYKYINLKRDNLLESRVYKYHSGLNNGTILRKLFLCVQMPKYLKRL